jgi:prefoldin subunit 5
MSSIKDALRVIAAEKRIEELGAAIDLLDKRMTELDEKLDAVATSVAASEARMRQAMPSPRPIERR